MVNNLDATLLALGEPTRRRVVELLARRPHRAGELADAVGLTAPAMSRHLRVLRECGLIEEAGSDDDRRVRVFGLRTAPIGELGDWLSELQAFWSAQLAAFKAHAERPPRPRQRSRRRR